MKVGGFGVGTEMRALVASWGLLLHDEGARGGVEGCRGLFGRQFGGSRVPKKKFYNFEEPSQRPKTAKRAPKCPPRRPKISPREPQDTCKSIFLAKTLIYQKLANSVGEIKVFEQVPKGVGAEMKVLVASWGLLLHDEGAWSAVEGCRGLCERQFGGSRVPKEKVLEIRGAI